MNCASRELRDVIINFITSLRPFGGKICLRQTAASSDKTKTKVNFVFLLLAAIDFAFTSLDHTIHTFYIKIDQSSPRFMV